MLNDRALGLKLGLGIALAVALLILATYFVPAHSVAVSALEQIRGFGQGAPIIYGAFFVVAAVLGFSRSVLIILAGVLFSPALAFGVVTVSIAITALVSFTLGRVFLKEWVNAKLATMPTAMRLLASVDDHGFKMVVLMRLNPFIPGFVNGYGFSVTPIRLSPYLLGSVLGALPLASIYIYLGWIGGRSILLDGTNFYDEFGVSTVLGLLVSAVLLLAVTWLGRRSLKSVDDEVAKQEI